MGLVERPSWASLIQRSLNVPLANPMMSCLVFSSIRGFLSFKSFLYASIGRFLLKHTLFDGRVAHSNTNIGRVFACFLSGCRKHHTTPTLLKNERREMTSHRLIFFLEPLTRKSSYSACITYSARLCRGFGSFIAYASNLRILVSEYALHF